MKLSETIKSKYLRVSDLGPDGLLLTIKDAAMEEVGEDEKLVVRFRETTKGLVMNKVNTDMLTELSGDKDINDYAGQRVRLVESAEKFNGKKGIRIAAAPTKKAQAPTEPEPGEENEVPYE